MSSDNAVRVSKVENIVDTIKLLLEGGTALLGIAVGAGTLCKVTRTFIEKKNDPVGYWNNKLGSSETSKALNRLADVGERLIMKL